MNDFKMKGKNVGDAAERMEIKIDLTDAPTIYYSMNNEAKKDLDVIFDEANKLMSAYVGTSNFLKGNKTLIYHSDFEAKTAVVDPWVGRLNVYAVYSNRKGANGKYGFKDFVFEVRNADFEVVFESCSITEAFAFIGDMVAEANENYPDECQFAMESSIDDAVETIRKTIDEVKETIDGLDEQDWWELDMDGIKENISDAGRLIMDCLNEIGQARENYIDAMSDFYECDYVLGDTYCDIPVISCGPYFEDLDDFNATDAFEQIVWWLFEKPAEKYAENPDKYEELLGLRDTLFHYLAVA